jgi:hypothetical protein
VRLDPCDDEPDFLAKEALEGEHIDEEMTDNREAMEGLCSGAESEDGAEDGGFDKVGANIYPQQRVC